MRDDVMSSLSGWPVGEREREREGGAWSFLLLSQSFPSADQRSE